MDNEFSFSWFYFLSRSRRRREKVKSMKISVYFVLKSLSESEVPDDFNSFEIDDWKAIERVFDAT